MWIHVIWWWFAGKEQPIGIPPYRVPVQHWRPLSAVLDPIFEPHADLIDLALQNIGTFRDWFRANYDIYFHAETLTMVDDATLLFETVQHLLLLKPTPETTSDTVADSTGGPSATAPPTDIEPSPSRLYQNDSWTTDTNWWRRRCFWIACLGHTGDTRLINCGGFVNSGYCHDQATLVAGFDGIRRM